MKTPAGERKGDSPSGSAANGLPRRGVSFLSFLLSCFYLGVSLSARRSRALVIDKLTPNSQDVKSNSF